MSIFDYLAYYPWLGIGLTTTLGLLVGSFLNVVIYRIPIMMETEWREQCAMLDSEDDADQDNITSKGEPAFNLAVPRSRCPHCQHLITAIENIPVVSYLFLKGKCSSCSKPISPRYPIIEAVTGALSGLMVYQFGFDWNSLLLLFFLWTLISLTMIDYDHHLLPDSLTLPLLWLGLIANSFGLFTDLSSAFWGAVAGYLSLWSVYWGFKLLTGKEGMGYGDFKLLAALGAWMGWQMLPVIIILSSLVGAVIGILLMVTAGRKGSKPMPFGPFLAAAGLIAMFWGEALIKSYLQVVGL